MLNALTRTFCPASVVCWEVTKEPAPCPQPAAAQQNTELSLPSDNAAHVSFPGTRDGGERGSHICQIFNSQLQSAPVQEL